ncbi:MAG: hypothetical protein HOB40_07515 [Candidatus Marinimicrobia bacterium]|nr:hypothetical protein [Candidatus Neomarinimicrobiota bacterium]MBT3501316.1 hypothetical protein [Candidatus Neomarinimicrobiota bacterium]MBT3838516.1 hypothetical protein [Candidatus Neomarinimicrobiota bacterium]MBT3999898.1 hypothetical protein [Candidatus Neomarinimicrobiota bacterium]MBT4282547.1 hypothetical protein [Candidatus Neomarinimicrobiota bacterium]
MDLLKFSSAQRVTGYILNTSQHLLRWNIMIFWKFAKLINGKNHFSQKGNITIPLVKNQIYLNIENQHVHLLQSVISKVVLLLQDEYLMFQGLLSLDQYSSDAIKMMSYPRELN